MIRNSNRTHPNNAGYQIRNAFDSKATQQQFINPFVDKRSCTDVICLFILLTFVSTWSVVALLAIKHGDIRSLVYPTDSLVSINEDSKILFMCLLGEVVESYLIVSCL